MDSGRTQSTALPSSGSGDLGLSTDITEPSCDGSFIVVVASVVNAPYADQVREHLTATVGSDYLRTDRTCDSLRASAASGNPIYAVYLGPFDELSAACARRDEVGGDAYIKILDNSTPAGQVQQCTGGAAPASSDNGSESSTGLGSEEDPYGCLAADRAGLSSAEHPCTSHFHDSTDPTLMEPDTPATRWGLCNGPTSSDDPDYLVGARERYCA